MTSAVETADGRRLAVFARGSGTDVVLFEAGLGFSGRYWDAAMTALPATMRAVTYDRAGIGTSTPDQAPRTLDRLALDCCRVVEAQHADRIVLVGHSWGGPIVRRAAARLLEPGRPVAGVVLVDPTDEGCDLYFSRLSFVSDRILAGTLPLLAVTGALRWSVRRMVAGLAASDARDAVVRASTTRAAARATVEENRHIRPGLESLRGEGHRLDGIPVTIVSGVQASRLGQRDSLVRAHRRAAARYARGGFVEAHDSTHLVPLTEPGLIAAEIVRILIPAADGRDGAWMEP